MYGLEPGTITVDFAVPETPVPMGGILEGIKAGAPGDDKILPVRVGGEYARHFTYGDYRPAAARSKQLGYRLIIRLDRYEWLHGKWPYEDWGLWEQFVKEQSAFWGKDVIYDVWNEPDQTMFWKGTASQYDETYIHAWRVLNTAFGSDAQVTGPSSAIYKSELISSFLDACQAAQVKVPILNWHELVDARPSQIKAHLDEQRAQSRLPARSGLGIGKITINEAFPTEDAGSTVATFWALEAGHADGACNSCFNNDCDKGTLSGLLNCDDGRNRRSSWFVYEAYAAGVKQRVRAISSSEKIAGLGSAGMAAHPEMAQVVIGYDAAATDPATTEVTLDLKHLDQISGFKAETCKVSIYRLANSGDAPSEGFKLDSTHPQTMQNGGLILKAKLARQDVLRVEIAP